MPTLGNLQAPMQGSRSGGRGRRLPTVELEGKAARMERAEIQPGPGAYIGKGLQELGATLHDVTKAVREQAELAQSSRIFSETAVKLKELEIELDREADHTDYSKRWDEGAKFIRDDALEGQAAPFSVTVRRQLEARLNDLLKTGTIRALETEQRKSINFQRAEGIKFLDSTAELAAREKDPSLRFQHMQDAALRIETMRQGGVITDVEAVEGQQRFRKQVAGELQKYFASDLNDELDNLTNKAFREPINAASYEREGLRAIDAAGASWLPAEKLNEVKQSYRNALWSGAVKSRIEADPYQTLAELKAGKYDAALEQRSLVALSGEAGVEIKRLEREAEAEIERRRRKAEAEQRARHGVVKDALKDFREASMLGYQWAGNTEQLRRAVSEFPDLAADFRQAQAFSGEKKRFSQMNDVEREAYLRQVEGGAQTGDSAKFIESLRTADTKIKTELSKDPLSFAARQGLINLGQVDISNPASLQQRSEQARMTEQYYGRAVSPLTDDESTAIIGQLQKMPADGKVQVLRQLGQAFTPRQTQSFAAQMDRKGAGELAQAFGMSTQVPEAASRIIQGMEIKRAEPRAIPMGSAKTTAELYMNEQLAEAYRADPRAMEAAKESIYSVYAWASRETADFSGEYKKRRLDNAITTVTGGLVSFNGSPTLPPRYGVDETRLRFMIPKADFSQADFTGDLGSAILNFGKLTAIGPGRYAVQIGGGVVTDKVGRPFVLDLGGIEPGEAPAREGAKIPKILERP